MQVNITQNWNGTLTNKYLPCSPSQHWHWRHVSYFYSQNTKCDFESLRQLCRGNHQSLLPCDWRSLMWAELLPSSWFSCGWRQWNCCCQLSGERKGVVPYANPLRHDSPRQLLSYKVASSLFAMNLSPACLPSAVKEMMKRHDQRRWFRRLNLFSKTFHSCQQFWNHLE